MNILVINGPNLNMLGIRDKEIYGSRTYNDLVEMIEEYALVKNVSVKCVQSNYEGEIIDFIHKSINKYDGIIMPAAASIAPRFDEKSDKLSDKYLILDNHMVIGNFGGFPSITIPSGFVDNMPVGINITGRVMEDDVVLNIANKIEGSMEYANQIAKEMK